MRLVIVENLDISMSQEGGVATYIRNISNYLVKKGIHTILTCTSQNPNIYPFGNEKIDFIKLDKKKIGHFSFIIKSLLNKKKITLKENDIIYGQRLDVIFPYLLYNKKCTSVCISHGNINNSIKLKRGFLSWLVFQLIEKYTIKRLQLLITVDPKNRDYYKCKYPKMESKIHYLPIGVDLKKFHPMNKENLRKKYNFSFDDKVILYIGRIEAEKNIKLILDSFLEVKSEIKSSRLIIVGSGREENWAKEYVAKKGIPDVIFWGNIKHEIMPKVINLANVLVLASFFEGSPTVVKEALACNVPVVSTNVGDLITVLKKFHGCYIAQNNVNDFTTKVKLVLRNNIEYDYHVPVSEYNNEKLFEKTISLLTNEQSVKAT